MKHLAALLAIVPCLTVQGFLVTEDASSLPSHNDTRHAPPSLDITTHQSTRADPDVPRVVSQTAFGTKMLTWPGRSEDPGDYDLFKTVYETKSASTKSSEVKFEIQVLGGEGNCRIHKVYD